MKHLFSISILLVSILLSINSFAQSDTVRLPSGKKPRYYIMETDTVPELIFTPDTIPTRKKRKPKKPKKKIFYELKCKKGFIRTISGTSGNVTLERFYYLKTWKDPNPYIPDLYVWDLTKNKILKVSKIEADKQPNYRVLHGPYTRELNGVVTERGAYYVGTKHARWEAFDKNDLLIGKTKFYKGWKKKKKITYFDESRRKVKEVMPYEYGKLQGDYYLFGEKGLVLSKGRYQNGVKIGLWIDYFPDSPNRKRETQFPEDPYDTTTQPVIVKEWNDKGKLVIIDGKVVPEGSKQQEAEDPIKKRLKRKR